MFEHVNAINASRRNQFVFTSESISDSLCIFFCCWSISKKNITQFHLDDTIQTVLHIRDFSSQMDFTLPIWIKFPKWNWCNVNLLYQCKKNVTESSALTNIIKANRRLIHWNQCHWFNLIWTKKMNVLRKDFGVQNKIDSLFLLSSKYHSISNQS